MLARCVTIPDAEKATVIWFAFSDVPWTHEVYSKHDKNISHDINLPDGTEKANYRALNMRKFDVKKWLGRKEHEHVCKVSEVAKHVAEFSMGYMETDGMFAKHFSPFGFSTAPLKTFPTLPDWRRIGLSLKKPFTTSDPDYATPEEIAEIKKRGGTALLDKIKSWFRTASMNLTPVQQLAAQCERATKGGKAEIQGMAAVLAIPDPAGITMDLAAMVDWRLNQFNTHQYEKHKRGIVVGGIIGQVRDGVMDQAESELRNAVKQETAAMDNRESNNGLKYSPFQLRRNVLASKLENININKTRADAWKKYEKRYHEDKRAAEVEQCNEELKAFNERVINSLARVHNNWMRSAALKNYFVCNFDTNDIRSGYGYTALATLCIGNMQQCALGMDLYYRWMDGDVTDESNILLRALNLNQDMRANAVKAAINKVGDGSSYVGVGQEEGFDPISFASSFLGGIAALIETADPEAEDNLLAVASSKIGGVLAQRAKDYYGGRQGITRTNQLPTWLLNFSGSTGTPIIAVRVGSTVEQNIRRLHLEVAKLAEARGFRIDRPRLEMLTNDILDPMRASGVLNRRTEHVELLILNRQKLDKALSELKPGQRVESVLRRILGDGIFDTATVDQVAGMRTQICEEAIGTGARMAMSSALSVVSFALSIWNFISSARSFEDEPGADPIIKNEKFQKLMASFVGMMLSTASTAEIVLKPFTGGVGRLSRSLEAFNKSWCIRGLGVLVSVVAVVWDSFHAWQAAQNGRVGLAIAYGVSAGIGIAGIGLTIAGWFVSGAIAAMLTGVGIILIFVGVAVSLIIAWLTGDGLQQWLERCYYGTFKDGPNSEKYKRLEDDVRGFEKLQEAASAVTEEAKREAERKRLERYMGDTLPTMA
jgi:hypothetical protein